MERKPRFGHQEKKLKKLIIRIKTALSGCIYTPTTHTHVYEYTSYEEWEVSRDIRCKVINKKHYIHTYLVQNVEFTILHQKDKFHEKANQRSESKIMTGANHLPWFRLLLLHSSMRSGHLRSHSLVFAHRKKFVWCHPGSKHLSTNIRNILLSEM